MTWPIPPERTVIARQSQRVSQPALHFDRDCMQLAKVDDDLIAEIERGDRPFAEPCRRCLGEVEYPSPDPTISAQDLIEMDPDDVGGDQGESA